MEGLCGMERSQEFGEMKNFQSKMGFFFLDMEIDFWGGVVIDCKFKKACHVEQA
jgi:hypothetical protein